MVAREHVIWWNSSLAHDDRAERRVEKFRTQIYAADRHFREIFIHLRAQASIIIVFDSVSSASLL